LKTISGIEITDFIDIFASTDEYKKYLVVSDARIRFVKRDKKLDSYDTSISQVIHEYCINSDADLILMIHATSPMLNENTILKCLENVMSGNFDSAATMIAIREFAYFNDNPINFDPTQPLPRLQDIKPILAEQGGLWVFKRVEFLNQHKRVLGKTYFHVIGGTEATDIDFKSDLDYLKYTLKDNSDRNV
jgi:CMP-N-acetylneuraminic acid synthetase